MGSLHGFVRWADGVAWRNCVCPLFGPRRDNAGYSIGMELIFEIRDAEEGGYCARALGHSIFTEADTWEELRQNVLDATSLHFEDSSFVAVFGATALRER